MLHIDHLTPKQVRAYRIADTRLAEWAGWDEQLLRIEFQELEALEFQFDPSITGFESVEIDMTLQAAPGADEEDTADAIPDLADEAVSRPGDPLRDPDHSLRTGTTVPGCDRASRQPRRLRSSAT